LEQLNTKAKTARAETKNMRRMDDSESGAFL